MHVLRHPIVALALLCCMLGACGGDKSAASANVPASQASSASAAASPTQPAGGGGGAVDCATLKTALASMLVNWQVVIGLSNVAASGWATTPIGSLPKFGDQLATIKAGLGGDADAAAALDFMSGANDIVQRGIGGDAAAQADLATYMGADGGVNIAKQLKVSAAFQKVGCK